MAIRCALLCALTLGNGPAAAQPPRPAPDAARVRAWTELRLHLGDSAQDEVIHPGLFPSLVLGADADLGRGLRAELAVSYSKVTAQWENLGGWSNAWLGLRHQARGLTVGAGLAVPLRQALAAPACFQPGSQGGDSQTYAFDSQPACWDRSAFRRAALHRGMWDAWMWAPDWFTAALTARADELPGARWMALHGGMGLGLPATDAHDGRLALVTQLALDAHHRWPALGRLGARLLAAGAFVDDHSPFVISLEAYLRRRVGPVLGQFTFTLPVADLGNAPVPPGQGGYHVLELWSIGTALSVEY